MQVIRGRARPTTDERGVVAITVAVSMTMLLVVTAMVLDFGLMRYDRQQLKLSADNAVMSGLRAADGGSADVYTWRGVCGALAFLRANESALSGLPDGPCATPDNSAKCDPLDPTNTANAAAYSQSVSVGDRTLLVSIKLPYKLSDPGFTGDSGFPEESYASLAGDPSQMNDCDQLGVIIKEARSPGLGSLATSSQLRTRVRSVGRVAIGPGGELAPALLLLEPSRCSVLTVGSSGSPSRIAVAGVGTMPGTIHADSTATGSDCGSGSNQQLFQGHQTGGIVAYGTGAVSGTVTSVATLNGVASAIVQDSTSNVYGTTGVYGGATGTTSPVAGHKPVTRKPPDARYLPGVTTTVRAAYAEWAKDHSAPSGYTRYGCPSASDMTAMAGLGSSDAVYIDCPDSAGITLDGTIGAGRIFFHGFIKGGVLKMPNARWIYVDNTNNSGGKVSDDAITLTNNTAFCVRASTCDTAYPSSGQCSMSPTGDPDDNAHLMILRGRLSGAGNNSLLRLCNTTVIMQGGQLGSGTASDPGACLPTSLGTAPTATPCSGTSTSTGTGQINTSGRTDWTAPNAYGDMSSLTNAEKWSLWANGEDLALWTESHGNNSNPTFTMAGGGNMHVAGVFMAPNAAPFQLKGSGDQDLSNAQYIVTSFSVDGGANLKMAVDPNNAVPEPDLDTFTLVR